MQFMLPCPEWDAHISLLNHTTCTIQQYCHFRVRFKILLLVLVVIIHALSYCKNLFINFDHFKQNMNS